MQVWNKRQRSVPKDAVYIGRPSGFGNPFTHIQNRSSLAAIHVVDRAAAVECYRHLVENSDLLVLAEEDGLTLAQLEQRLTLLDAQRTWIRAHLPELKGKDLVCWCAPLACHGDVLLRLANA